MTGQDDESPARGEAADAAVLNDDSAGLGDDSAFPEKEAGDASGESPPAAGVYDDQAGTASEAGGNGEAARSSGGKPETGDVSGGKTDSPDRPVGRGGDSPRKGEPPQVSGGKPESSRASTARPGPAEDFPSPDYYYDDYDGSGNGGKMKEREKEKAEENGREKAEETAREKACGRTGVAGDDAPEKGAPAESPKGSSRLTAAGGSGPGWGTLGSWWKASRPSFYIATLYPLFLGLIAAQKHMGATAAPDAGPRIWIFVLILVASFLVHLATNIANDYFEHSGGVDTKKSIGGSRVIQEGLIAPGAIKKAIGICYLAALAMAVIIVRDDWPLWGMVAFAALSSFLYGAPPVKYGHRALGELMVFINMGLIMTVGTFMALTGAVTGPAIALSVPGAFMVANILYYQSLPEIAADAQAGKTTLAGLLGKGSAALMQLIWWPIVWLLVTMLVLTGGLSVVALLCLFSLPLHVISMRRIWKAEDWLVLDRSGWLVKLLYVCTGLAVLAGAFWNPLLADSASPSHVRPVPKAAAAPPAVRAPQAAPQAAAPSVQSPQAAPQAAAPSVQSPQAAPQAAAPSVQPPQAVPQPAATSVQAYPSPQTTLAPGQGPPPVPQAPYATTSVPPGTIPLGAPEAQPRPAVQAAQQAAPAQP
jgi:1,4-dihydroxy-2-naphthoate octaprenyltransferase